MRGTQFAFLIGSIIVVALAGYLCEFTVFQFFVRQCFSKRNWRVPNKALENVSCTAFGPREEKRPPVLALLLVRDSSDRDSLYVR